jgi:transposase
MSDTPRKIGRRTKLTQEVQDRIVYAITSGNYIETAAAYAGISKNTLYRWLEQGEDPNADAVYRDFRDAVEIARAQAEVRNVALIQKAANDGTWQAAAWYLERTAWQRWGRRTMVTGDAGEAIKVEVDHRQKLRQVLGLDDDAAAADG